MRAAKSETGAGAVAKATNVSERTTYSAIRVLIRKKGSGPKVFSLFPIASRQFKRYNASVTRTSRMHSE